MVEEEPDISTRRLGAELGVLQFVVHRILKEQDLYPYHVKKVQTLKPAEFPSRVIYRELLLQQCFERSNFSPVI